MTIKTPQQARSLQTRTRIFQAARRVFAQLGPHGARVDQIARRAGVNKQRIYAYFGSKKDLYRAVLLDAYATAAHNERLLALNENDLPRLTAAVLEATFAFHDQHPLFWRLLTWENLNGGQSLTAADWASIRSAYLDHLAELHRRGQERGLFRWDVAFSTWLFTIFAASYFYFANQLTISRLLALPMTDAHVRERIVQHLATVLTQGFAPPSAGKQSSNGQAKISHRQQAQENQQ